MNNIDKISLLKELNYYSDLLAKHGALKKEKEFKSAIGHQSRIVQHDSKPKSFHSYKKVKNESSPVSCFNQKYSFKKSTHLGIPDQNVRNRVSNQSQNFNSKYSLSKNKVFGSTSPVNKFAINSKNLNSNISIMHAKSISNSKNEAVKVPGMSSNKSGKVTSNTKDFIKEIESLTELLKKKTSSNPLRRTVLYSENVTQNRQYSHKRNDKNSAFKSTNLLKKKIALAKAKCLVEMSSKMTENVSCANKRNCFLNYNNRNIPQQKGFSVNKFVYKKNDVNQSSNGTTAASLRNIKNLAESKDGCKNIISRSASTKFIFPNSKTNTADNAFQIKPSSSSTKELTTKLHTPNKIIHSSAKKSLKKSPHVSKIKSPVVFKIKPNSVKTPNIIKLKQTNTRYTKINKNLIQSGKKLQHQQKSSLRKNKKKVNNKYKVINKMSTPSMSRRTSNSLCSSVSKTKSLSTDCDILLKNLNDSAVEKLEQNLLAMSSELTAPLSSEKNKKNDGKVIQPSVTILNSKLKNKISPFKKSKSRISKYKIINSNVSRKYSLKNFQSVHTVTPLKRERAVLVRRLFKSKNVIINKNASPTNYSARIIKSKYISLNKRKSPNWQRYMYARGAPSAKFKGNYLPMNLHLKQKRFKTNAIATYHSRLIRKTDYRCPTYKNSRRERKNKINNRYARSPVVIIRGTKYAINLDGKTLRKLPIKGYAAKSFSRASTRLIMKTPENVFKSYPTSTNFANRALHRSINRILTASSKKKLSKVNTYCMFYNRFGRCNRGVKCTYIHDPSKIAVCTRFLRGTCKIDGCPFSHEVDPGKMAICSFFLVGQCDNENCPYRHEKLLPNAVLCKEFVQGYCHHGKECKKAHILICPKYMQGDCDKGSSCTFPHPPQKAKKNIQKEVEDEGTKPSEVLLEKVLRYFQQGGDAQNELGGKNLYVPKQKKLEEQPSFIPLNDSSFMHNDD